MMRRLAMVALAVWAAGCARPVRRPAEATRAPAASRPRIEAVLINGGGRKRNNYHSHMAHVRRLARLLVESGLPEKNITILASDGPDPAPDLAVREPGRFGEHWLIKGTELAGLLGPPVDYQNSFVEGLRLLPAKQAALQAWFHLRAGELGPGDTLLLFVTDHGRRGGAEHEATISLWEEKLPVSELVALLDSLDPEVRVILWMSQCYSAAFARAIYRDGEVLRGNVCGFFSTLENRPAWGCYPEARDDREGRGHAMRFLDELRPGAGLSAAHDRVVLTDRTPNVPHRSSDHFLGRLLERAAEKKKESSDRLADRLLEEAWKRPARFGRQIETIDGLARRAGMEPPRSLRDLQPIRVQLAKHIRLSRTYKQRWGECLDDLRKLRLAQFTDRQIRWKAKKFEHLLKKHGHEGGSPGENEKLRVELLEKLLGEFGAYLERHPRVKERLAMLHSKQQAVAELSIRMQAREGVVLRMWTLLRSIAGELMAEKDPNRLAGLDRLRACEGFALPGGPAGPDRAGRGRPTELPPLAEDLTKLQELRPAWLGVRYGPENREFREKHGLPAGAVVVRSVVAGSPAGQAGLRLGDTIFGASEQPFEEPGSLRERVMLSPPGRPLELQLLRDGKRLTVAARLAPYPEQVPVPAGPPAAGQPAPSLQGLKALEGQIPAENSPVLLVFFTTSCGPCKRAMPALVSWEQKHRVPVVLVSAEEQEKLAAWAAGWKERPGRIAQDPRGLVSETYRIRSYPTFVLLDTKGKIQDVKKGFSSEAGLPSP